MASKIHELKTWPEYFSAIRDKSKTFELRKQDRDFEVGDVLALAEYAPTSKSYTGETELRKITYILNGGEFGLEEGYCIIGLKSLID